MSAKYCVINDHLVPYHSANVGIMDLSIHRGYGIFDYFKIIDGRPIFLQAHLSRFLSSARQMRLKLPCSEEKLHELIHTLMNENDLPLSGIKLLLTGGYSEDGFTTGEPNLLIIQGPLPAYRDFNDQPINLVTWPYQRQLPHVKSIDYLMAVWLQPLIKEKSANDVLYIYNDIITECPRANIFIVTHDDQVLTPAKNVLAGITRSQLLRFTDEFDIREAEITVPALMAAKEVFITSSTKNVLPVARIDDTVFNNGQIGSVTKKLSERLISVINQH